MADRELGKDVECQRQIFESGFRMRNMTVPLRATSYGAALNRIISLVSIVHWNKRRLFIALTEASKQAYGSKYAIVGVSSGSVQ